MELQDQLFGIEIEMTGITREKAAQVMADYFGTESRYYGGTYEEYHAKDSQERTWKAVYDSSIDSQMRIDGRKARAPSEYQTEVVSPICRYEDIPTVQALVRKLRENGAFVNDTCGIHIHINAAPFDGKQLRNLVNIVAAKEDMVYRALKVDSNRERSYCKKIDPDFLEKINGEKKLTKEKLQNFWYRGDDQSHRHYDNSRYHCLNLHSVFQKGTIEFRAFNGNLHAGKIKAYVQFCMAITAQAHRQKYASPAKTVSTNEKYTFRVWLLRLGMIGDEFKTARGHLLDHLEGNIAWKDPAQAVAQKERLRAKREKGLTPTTAVEVPAHIEEPVHIEEPEQEEEPPAFSMSMTM